MLFAASAVTVAASALAAMAVAVTAVATSATTATASALAAQHAGHLLNFAVGGQARFAYLALEVKRLASQGVVQVDLNLAVADAQDPAEEAVTILVLQGNDGVGVDVLAVEASVYAEHLFVQVYDARVDILAVSTVGGEGEVKLVARGQRGYLGLEVFECGSKSAQEYKGLVGAGLLDQFRGRPATPCKVTNFLALFFAFVAIFLTIRLGLSLIFTYFAV